MRITAAKTVHPWISLSEDDVPGAKFAHASSTELKIPPARFVRPRGLYVLGLFPQCTPNPVGLPYY